jgi:hypothetical protein
VFSDRTIFSSSDRRSTTEYIQIFYCFPGIPGYEWLGCGGNTTNTDEEIEAVDYYIEAWRNSKVTSIYR